jgi:hypothetical protein
VTAPDEPNADHGAEHGADVAGAFTAARQALGLPPGAERRCRRCGAAYEPDADRCPKCRSFVPGTQARRTTGIRAKHHPAALRQTIAEFRDSVIADRGGPTETSTLELGYIAKLAEVETCARLLVNDLVLNGIFTPGGRHPRVTFDKYLTALSTWDRLAQRIGLDRRSRNVGTAADLESELARRRANVQIGSASTQEE